MNLKEKIKINFKKFWDFTKKILKVLTFFLFFYSLYLLWILFEYNIWIFFALSALELIIYSVIIVVFIFIYRKIKKKEFTKKEIKERIIKYSKRSIISMIIVLGLPIMFIKVYNKLDMGSNYLPIVVFENGEKYVKFQGMKHLGPVSFYKNVFYDMYMTLMIDKKSIIFFEGVTQSEPEDISDNYKKFFTPIEMSMDVIGLGTKFCNHIENYKDLKLESSFVDQSYALGVLGSKKYFKEYSDRYINVDISTKDISDALDGILEENPNLKEELVSASGKISKEIEEFNKMLEEYKDYPEKFIKWSYNASKKQKEIIDDVCYFAYNNTPKMTISMFSDKNYSKEEISELKGEEAYKYIMSDLILKLRNEKLAKEVQNSEYENIFITYGAAHLEGFYKELKKLDSNWKVKEIYWVKLDGVSLGEYDYEFDFLKK